MKKIITVYENKKNMKKFELIPEIEFEGKACLRDMETGEEKFYAQSTLKKNFFKTEQEIEVPDLVADEWAPELRACIIRNEVSYKEGVTVRETQSYIGIVFGKKSVAQIAFNKKHLTVSINKEEFYSYLESFESKPEVLEMINRCFYKEAPARYGWRMDFEIEVTDLSNADIVKIIETAIEARKVVIG